MPLLYEDPEVLFSPSDKSKLSAKSFSKNSNLDYSGIFLPALLSRNTLKKHDIHVSSKLVKMLITNPDSSKASGPDFITVAVRKNCETGLSYILLVELFNMCLKEFCFPDC